MITAWSDNDSPQVMYLVHAIEKFHVIPWLMIEFGFCALWSFFFFTAALAFAVKVKLLGPNSQLLPKICFGGWLPLAPDNTCSCAWVICTHKQLPLLRRAYMPYTIQRISLILYPAGLHSLPHPLTPKYNQFSLCIKADCDFLQAGPASLVAGAVFGFACCLVSFYF